jgi:hypothetical protein
MSLIYTAAPAEDRGAYFVTGNASDKSQSVAPSSWHPVSRPPVRGTCISRQTSFVEERGGESDPGCSSSPAIGSPGFARHANVVKGKR